MDVVMTLLFPAKVLTCDHTIFIIHWITATEYDKLKKIFAHKLVWITTMHFALNA